MTIHCIVHLLYQTCVEIVFCSATAVVAMFQARLNDSVANFSRQLLNDSSPQRAEFVLKVTSSLNDTLIGEGGISLVEIVGVTEGSIIIWLVFGYRVFFLKPPWHIKLKQLILLSIFLNNHAFLSNALLKKSSDMKFFLNLLAIPLSYTSYSRIHA